MMVTEEILREMEVHHPEQAQAWANGYSYGVRGVDTWDCLNPYEWNSVEFHLFAAGYEDGHWWFQTVASTSPVPEFDADGNPW